MDIKYYQKKIDSFVKDRNWEKFHNPKNLTMALSGEVGELSDILQWLTEEESKRENINDKTLCLVKEELADIFIYLIRIADKLDINIEEEVEEKIKLNGKKYPIHLSKDNNVKYNRR